ncbi:MAG TPA: hypothetical protein VGL73_02685 [Caulobacteraceae bacterium]
MTGYESYNAREAFAEAMADARIRLEPPVVRERVWPALAAAALFAISALVFATAAILAPPAHLTPVASVRGPV